MSENIERVIAQEYGVLKQDITPKFKINDSVATKITGFPGVGKVKSIIPPEILPSYKQVVRWDTIFPNWKQKWTYNVYFESPRKAIRWDEFLSSGNLTQEQFNQFDEECQLKIKSMYILIPEYTIISYAEDDLELFEV